MKKIGIITDIERIGKMEKFIRDLRERANVAIIVGEEELMEFKERKWDVDVIMAKTKNPVSLAILTSMEGRGIPMINSPRAIFLVYHRFLLNSILSRAGIPQPEFAFSLERTTPFKRAVVKGHQDLHAKKSPVHINYGNRELRENASGFYYSQEYIEPECEYKIYCIGDEVITYRQDIPVILNKEYHKNKFKYRTLVSAPDIEILAKRAVKVTGIKMCSMDVIGNKENYFLVDLNISPGLRDDKVIETLSNYLLEVAR